MKYLTIILLILIIGYNGIAEEEINNSKTNVFTNMEYYTNWFNTIDFDYTHYYVSTNIHISSYVLSDTISFNGLEFKIDDDGILQATFNGEMSNAASNALDSIIQLFKDSGYRLIRDE